jgi:hypothetical protein
VLPEEEKKPDPIGVRSRVSMGWEVDRKTDPLYGAATAPYIDALVLFFLNIRREGMPHNNK